METAPDDFFFFIMSLVFCLFLHEGICYGYSLELPQWSPNEYPKHIFLWINQENVYWDIPIILSYAEWLWNQIIWYDNPKFDKGMSWLRYELTKNEYE